MSTIRPWNYLVAFRHRPGAWLGALGLILGSCALGSCGYHVAGKADLVPKDVHTIAIPAFTNASVKYKLSDSLPEAISREFITRTRYKTVNDPTQADAVLSGSVVRYVAYPSLINQATGRTSGLQIIVVLNVTLTQRSTGKVIFSRPAYEAHERYELATPNPGASASSQNAANYQYFDESGAGLQRLSKDVARDLVTSILENF
jgi:hypothetical protein